MCNIILIANTKQLIDGITIALLPVFIKDRMFNLSLIRMTTQDLLFNSFYSSVLYLCSPFLEYTYMNVFMFNSYATFECCHTCFFLARIGFRKKFDFCHLMRLNQKFKILKNKQIFFNCFSKYGLKITKTHISHKNIDRRTDI